eukprot:7088583-Pyramimonas_sp.AAC.2
MRGITNIRVHRCGDRTHEWRQCVQTTRRTNRAGVLVRVAHAVRVENTSPIGVVKRACCPHAARENAHREPP